MLVAELQVIRFEKLNKMRVITNKKLKKHLNNLILFLITLISFEMIFQKITWGLFRK